MSEKPQGTGKSRVAGMAILAVVIGALLLYLQATRKDAKAARLESQLKHAETEQFLLHKDIEELEKAAAQREEEFKTMQAQLAARETELAQREAAIVGREDAASERTQSSFQGLLIQQQLTKNLEALKASLPDMTPEMERLTREHAQFDAERQRLQRENAELRRKLNGATPLQSR